MVTNGTKVKRIPVGRSKVGSAVQTNKKPRPRRLLGGNTEQAKQRDEHHQTALAVLEQFRLIFRSAKKHFQWVRDRTGVSGAQLWVLAELRREPGIRVTELARALAIHQTTASNLIERLERQKFIKRDRSGLDHRVVHLSLTKKGQDTVAGAPLPLEGVLPDALNCLAHDELVELRRRLDQLAKLMKVRDRAGKRIPLAEM